MKKKAKQTGERMTRTGLHLLLGGGFVQIETSEGVKTNSFTNGKYTTYQKTKRDCRVRQGEKEITATSWSQMGKKLQHPTSRGSLEAT